jgi:hypothetical protein
MARTGRPKALHPKKKTTFYLDEKIVNALEVIDYDPFLARRTYGNRNHYVEEAIREYLEKNFPEIAIKFLREAE